MTTLLVVEASPRGDSSVSRNMSRRFIEYWRAAHPGGEVVRRDLVKSELPFVTASWLEAYFTPPEHQSLEMKSELRLSDALVDEVLGAEHIVVATPVYNYNVPAVLKAWIDHIVRKGMTLGFDGSGLVRNTRASLLFASGGSYTDDSPIRDRDIATHYLTLIMRVIGVTDVTVVAGGGAKAVDLGDKTMDDFVKSLDDDIRRSAER